MMIMIMMNCVQVYILQLVAQTALLPNFIIGNDKKYVKDDKSVMVHRLVLVCEPHIIIYNFDIVVIVLIFLVCSCNGDFTCSLGCCRINVCNEIGIVTSLFSLKSLLFQDNSPCKMLDLLTNLPCCQTKNF